MTDDHLVWAVFVAVLAPLFLHMPTDPLAMTALHVGLCLAMVTLADHRECRS